MMPLDKWIEKLEDNIFLVKICRSSCPVAEVSGVETYTPHSILYIIYLLITGQIQWNNENTFPLYMCQLCGRCNRQCEGFPFTDIIREARYETYLKGNVPPKIRQAILDIEETFSKWRKNLKKDLKGIEGEGGDTILIPGEGYWQYPDKIKKAIQILQKFYGNISTN